MEFGERTTNTLRLAQTDSLVQVRAGASVDVLVMRGQPQAVSRQAGKPDCSLGWGRIVDQRAGGALAAVWDCLGGVESGEEGVWLISGHADAKSRK